jgi:hypothetical protein
VGTVNRIAGLTAEQRDQVIGLTPAKLLRL